MHRKRYPFAAYLLVLAVALTGYQMAVARAQPAPAGEVVICSGLGLVTVLVDETGAPVSRAHVCPDGLLTLFTSVGGGWEPPVHASVWHDVAQGDAIWRAEGRRAPGPQARDPPPGV